MRNYRACVSVHCIFFWNCWRGCVNFYVHVATVTVTQPLQLLIPLHWCNQIDVTSDLGLSNNNNANDYAASQEICGWFVDIF